MWKSNTHKETPKEAYLLLFSQLWSTFPHCPDKTQAAFEAWRYHETHNQFGRAYQPHGRHNRDYKLICHHNTQANCHPSYWQSGPQRSVWARPIAFNGFAEGPSSHALFGTNLTGLGTTAFYSALHSWLTSFEGVIQCVIACPHLHGTAHFHVHCATHAMARDMKIWFDSNHRATLQLRHAPSSMLSVKFSNFTSETAPEEVRIPTSNLWHDERVKASWDPSVTHPFPCPAPPNPADCNPQAWNEWYLHYCGLEEAPLDNLGAPGTHQGGWKDPSVPRGRSLSRGRARSQSPSASRATPRR